MKSKCLRISWLMVFVLLSACQGGMVSTPAAFQSQSPGASQTPEAISPSKPSSTEMTTVTITIVYDNNEYDPRLTTAWGFSAVVEFMGHTILFDVGGDSPTLLSNMSILDVDLAAIEMVVLSHAHGDHTGGIEGLLAQGIQPTVHMLPSFSQSFKDRIGRSTTVAEVEPGQLLSPEIYTTGEMGTSIPEQALVINSSRGLIVITGCAHPGVVQMAESAHELLDQPLYLVLGGFHLGNMSLSEIDSIVAGFRRLGVEKVAPCHCTGDLALRRLSQEYGDDFIQAGVGRVIVIEP
ncbi:MAG: MBL fold metallo-hydrolase [Anaerolineales bacterium]|jgi:7,8-dihydropterin-6-yl-methyl-4-(beta-D-ribofuranosyl)aminobenzene 5'-phosphate synthase